MTKLLVPVSVAKLFLLVLCLGAIAGFGPRGLDSRGDPLANTTILIIRHAEKPPVGYGLTPVGEERARRYVKYFAGFKLDGKPVHIDDIFAAADSKKSHRPRLTIEPLSQALHKPIDLRFTDKEPEGIATELKSKDHGRVILVCWRHGEIPDLIEALGVPVAKLIPSGRWPDDVFDRVIELRFDSHGRLDSRKSGVIDEHLMPGDPQDPKAFGPAPGG